MRETALIIGAGLGGLAAAISLAQSGWAVTVIETRDHAGGKMRETSAGDVRIDSGPTVLTMAWVFEALFADAGERLGDHVTLKPLSTLARHAWRDGACLDLFSERARTADAIGRLSGAGDANGYLAFCAEAQRMFEVLRAPFLEAQKPRNPLELALRVGHLGDLMAIRPFESMWSALRRHFHDPRLRQLFGRYATYCGSSPFRAPATLMLIAHVEQVGVWSVDGGVARLAEALEALARRLGVSFRFGETVEAIELAGGRACAVRTDHGARLRANAIVCNADPAALSSGLLGRAAKRATARARKSHRSLSALTWSLKAAASGFPLVRHNVFFSDDYAREFADLAHAPARDPTIYVCAQDRCDDAGAPQGERLFMLINAPAARPALSEAEVNACLATVIKRLAENGLTVTPEAVTATTPTAFANLFPATQGALYGQATHGWAGAFLRPGAASRVPGLYLAGAGAHPGAGAPMAALSGRLAAEQIARDFASTPRSRSAATPGGMSTHSVKTAPTA